MMIGTIKHIVFRPIYPIVGHHLTARITETRFASMSHVMLVPARRTQIQTVSQFILISARQNLFDILHNRFPNPIFKQRIKIFPIILENLFDCIIAVFRFY